MSEFPGIQTVLESHSALTMNEHDRTLHLIRDVNGCPKLIEISQFSPTEWRILLPILRAYPGYVAYEDLLAAFRGVSLAVAQQQLENARHAKKLRQELKAIRNAVDHIDQKLAKFHFTLLSIPKVGYTLSLLREKNGNSPSFSVM